MKVVCYYCNFNKDISDFSRIAKTSRGTNECKACKKEYDKQYRELNKEKLKDQRQSYKLLKEDQIRYNKKLYYELNKKSINDKCAKYYINNQEIIKNKTSNYRKLNKDKRQKREKIRKQSDLLYSLQCNIRSSLTKALKRNQVSKRNSSCLNFLSYTIIELKNHLENLFQPWMSWKNYSIYNAKTWNDNDQNTWTWQIDHIIPQSILPFNSIEDYNFKLCWSLNNLRPYSAKQNILDGSSRVRHQLGRK